MKPILLFTKSPVIFCFCFLLFACGGNPVLQDQSTPITLVAPDPPLPPPEPDPLCLVNEQDWLDYVPPSAPDVWAKIRDGFQLTGEKNKRIEQQLRWYTRHPGYMERVAKRGEPYLYHIVQEVHRRGLPMELALLPIVESAFDPFAYSHGKASGIWQFIPWTGKSYGLKQNWWYDGRRDIVASTDAALRYLERMHKRFEGDWLLAIASYNSGAGNVNKAIRKNKRLGRPTDFWHLQLPRETKAYVPRLLAVSKLIGKPENYQLSLYSVSNTPWFASVDVGSQIDLAQAAELADIDMDTLYKLNPAFNRWATDPDGPHSLLVPREKAAAFAEKIAAMPQEERISWARYKIRSGDSLSTIAQKFNLRVSALKSINRLRSNRIRAGKTLLVPQASKENAHYIHSAPQRLMRKQASGKGKPSKATRIEYLVKKGDSFWSIGRHFKVQTRQLAKWNNMAPTDTLRIGQKITVWTHTPKTASIDSPAVIRKLAYRVRKGDSLARIASKFSVPMGDITKWNNVNTSRYLQPGEILTLYVNVKANL